LVENVSVDEKEIKKAERKEANAITKMVKKAERKDAGA
jgi:hypothetical protein